MKKKINPELIGDDNPELTDEFFKNAKSFSELPDSLQNKLAKIQLQAQIEKIRAKLIEAENSGFTNQTAEEIRE